MKSGKLLSTLSKLSVISKKYEDINSGGCGAFALSLSNELTKRNIKHDILWIGDRYARAKDIKKILKTNESVNLQTFNDNGIFLSHVMIKIKKAFIDAEGVFNGFDNTKWSHRAALTKLSNKELEMLVNDEYGWNDTFDRDDIPKINKNIKKICEKLDK